MSVAYQVIGKPMPRTDARSKVLGQATYADDLSLPGMLFGVVVRSPHAAANIRSVDVAAAKAVPGVRAVYTSADLDADGIGGLPCAAPVENVDGTPMAAPPHPVLAKGAVHHVGDPVAFVVAGLYQHRSNCSLAGDI